MKVKYINSATVVIESEGIKVLCDPWLVDGAYYGSWCHYPPLNINIEDYFDVDYIYISHIHPDHLNLETLNFFPKNIPVIIQDYEQKFVMRNIASLGFNNIIEVGHKKIFSLGKSFNLEILSADNCDPIKCGLFMGCNVGPGYSKSQSIDTIAVFNDNNCTVVNTNDCPYELAEDVCKYIKNKYKNIDMLLVGYLGAGPYPQCFPEISLREKISACNSKKYSFYQQTINYILSLSPRNFIPFAGKYTLSGKLSNLNKWKGNPDYEELEEDFLPYANKQNINSNMILLERETEIDVKEINLKSNYKSINFNDRDLYIKNVLSKRIFTYENENAFIINNMQKELEIAQERKLKLQNIYNFYSNWNVYLDINKDFFIKVPYDNNQISLVDKISNDSPWLKIELDEKLLTAVLKRKAHWNNMEIGSHLKFTRSQNKYVRGIHHFLSFFHA